MRKGTVLSLKSCNKILDFLIKNHILIILTICFVSGLIAGIFTLHKYDTIENWNISFLESFITSRSEKSFLNIAVNSFFGSMLFIMLCFVCGSSVLGAILVPLNVIMRGFLYGGTAALLYSEYLLKGIAFHTVLILPSAIVFLFGFLFAAREAFNFSLMLTQLTFPQSMPMNISFQFRSYCIKFLLISVIIVFSAVVDAVLCGNFITVFSL